MRYLIVPGYTGSGPQHWQTRLENSYCGMSRVLQDHWDVVDRTQWISRLDEHVRSSQEPAFLIGHSCGSVTIAQWAAECDTSPVFGALLVAPADVDAEAARPAIRAQAPLPRTRLPINAHIVASDNDPHLTTGRAEELARIWGCSLEFIPGAGHLASDDGFGDWDYPIDLIERLTGHRPAPNWDVVP